MMLQLLVVLCALAPLKATAGDPRSVNDAIEAYLQKNPSLKPYQKFFYSQGTHRETPISYTPEQLQYLRKVFKLGGMQNTNFGKVLRGASVPDTSRFHDLNVASIVSRMREDPALLSRFITSMTRYAQRKKDDTATQNDYGNCTVDYNAFVTPILEALPSLICDLICEEIPVLCALCGSLTPEEEVPDWGWGMIDAMGKIPEGLAEGKLHWVGAYEYCNEYKVVYNRSQETRQFSGKYCRLDLTPDEPFVEDLGNTTLSLQFGVCAPSTCSPSDVTDYINDNEVLKFILDELLGMEVTAVYCGRELDVSSDRSLHSALGVIGVLLLLVIIATIWDGCFRRNWISKKVDSLPRHTVMSGGYSPQKNVIGRSVSVSNNPLVETAEQAEKALSIGCSERLEMALTGFSFYSNVSKICKGQDKRDFIPELNGIRAMSYGFLLIGHVLLFGPVYNECWVTANLLGAALRLPKEWILQIVINFSLNSDSFLFLSGTLTTYWWLVHYSKQKRITCGGVAYYIIHRYWRLMPHLMLCLMFYAICTPYLNDGPLFPPFIQDSRNCLNNWWPNLLMVNNFVNKDRSCLTWMWYPAMLFQLHIVTLIVLIPLVLLPTLGYVLMAAMFVAHIGAAAGILSNVHDDLEQWYWQYLVTPYGRAGPYVIGLACGALLHRYKSRPPRIPTLLHLAVWVAALAVMLGAVFATHDQFKEGGVLWDKNRDVAYDLLSRNAWGLGLAWIVFACHTGHGGIVSSILSHGLWRPLSKLVYVTLPLHAVLVFNLSYSRYTMLYISVFHLLYDVFSHFWTTIGIGLIVGCVFHYPISIGLERAVLVKNKLQWIKTGRHPEEEIETIEKEYEVAWNANNKDSSNGHANDAFSADNGQVAPITPPPEYASTIPGVNYVQYSKGDDMNRGHMEMTNL